MCLQCEGTYLRIDLVNHYKKDCLDTDGVGCVAAPYCRIRGTRRDIKEHEVTCGYVKIPCPKCESTVIRKMMGVSHSCFDSAVKRL